MNLKGNIVKYFPSNKYLNIIPGIKDEKTQAYVTLIATLIALSFFGFFAINPTLGTIVQLKKQLSDSEFINEKLDEKIENLSTLQQKYNLLENDLPVVYSSVPQNPKATLLAGQLQSIVKSSNLTLRKLQIFEIELSNPKTQAKPSQGNIINYSRFEFSFDAQGSYIDITNCLDTLSQFDRIVIIETTVLNKQTEKNESVSVSVKGNAIFLK